MEVLNYKDLEIKPHNILISQTSEPYFEMSRFILLDYYYERNENRYVVLEGYHCSCYDFDETIWEATGYTEEELIKLSKADYNENEIFWEEVKKHVY